jgi:hypothetical protein
MIETLSRSHLKNGGFEIASRLANLHLESGPFHVII